MKTVQLKSIYMHTKLVPLYVYVLWSLKVYVQCNVKIV